MVARAERSHRYVVLNLSLLGITASADVSHSLGFEQ